jgi:hypothetical protein
MSGAQPVLNNNNTDARILELFKMTFADKNSFSMVTHRRVES